MKNKMILNPEQIFPLFPPWHEVVLAAVYLALTQLPDWQGAAKVHMHAAISFLKDFGSLHQTLQRKSKAGSETWAGNNQLYSCKNPQDPHLQVNEVEEQNILLPNTLCGWNVFFLPCIFTSLKHIMFVKIQRSRGVMWPGHTMVLSLGLGTPSNSCASSDSSRTRS